METPTQSDPATEKQYAIFSHLMPLAGSLLAGFGMLLAPLIWWVLMKDKSPAVAQHGKEVLNVVISFAIYYAACIPLMIVLIGFPLAVALAITQLVLLIIGTIKASEGSLYKYPLILRLVK
jgi:uncharacterized protein